MPEMLKPLCVCVKSCEAVTTLQFITINDVTTLVLRLVKSLTALLIELK